MDGQADARPRMRHLLFRRELGQDTLDYDQNLGVPVQAQSPVTSYVTL